MLAAKSCLTLWTVAHQAPLSVGFSGKEYWSRLPCPSLGDLPDPGMEPVSPAWQADSLPLSRQGSPSLICVLYQSQAGPVLWLSPRAVRAPLSLDSESLKYFSDWFEAPIMPSTSVQMLSRQLSINCRGHIFLLGIVIPHLLWRALHSLALCIT